MQRYADIKQIIPEQGEKGGIEKDRAREGAGLWFKLKGGGRGGRKWRLACRQRVLERRYKKSGDLYRRAL